MRLVAQSPVAFDGVSYAPGDVLPERMHGLELLPFLVKNGTVWPEGRPSSTLLDAHTRTPLFGVDPVVLSGLIKRGQTTSLNASEPPAIHAAVIERDIMQARGHGQRYFASEQAAPTAQPKVQAKKQRG